VTAHRWGLALVALAISAVPLFADESTDVAIRCVIDPKTDSVLQSRTIHIYVHGIKPNVTLTDIRLSLNEVLRRSRPDLTTALRPNGYSETTEAHLGQGTKEFELVFDYPAGRFSSPLANFDLVQLEPGTQTLNFEAGSQAPPQPSSQPITPLPVEFPISAPMLSIMLGGCAGALALALLRFIYRLRSKRESVQWKREAAEALIAIGAGALIAWTLTFVGGLVSGDKLGIQISATSWKGGVIIGLFSYKIGDLLAQKLWDQPSAHEAKKKKNHK
jgi:hypothetical protein